MNSLIGGKNRKSNFEQFDELTLLYNFDFRFSRFDFIPFSIDLYKLYAKITTFNSFLMADNPSNKPGAGETREVVRRSNLNVLVADSDIGVQEKIKEALKKRLVGKIEGASFAGAIAFTLEQRSKEGEKNRVHLLILNGTIGGTKFADFIRGSMTARNCPFIAQVSSKTEEGTNKTEKELDDEIDKLITDAQNHIAEQTREEAVREDASRRGKLWWLEGRGYNLIHDVRNQLVAALDIDGTLFKDYLMERFLEHLLEDEEFMDLVKNHSSENGKARDVIEQIKNKEPGKRLDIENKLMEQLEKEPEKNPFDEIGGYKPFLMHLVLEMFKKAKKNKERNPEKDPYEEFGGYEKFIELTAKYFALICEGIGFETMLKFAEEFVKKDIEKGNVFAHTAPLIEMFQRVGFIVCFVTGAPREIVEALRKHYKIMATGEALESNYDDEGAGTGEVKFNSGLPRTKAKAIRQMQEAGHRIIVAAGDSIAADGEMITPAVFTTPGVTDDIYGGGLFFGETPKAIADAKNRFANEISTGRLKIVHRGDLAWEAIVDEARYQLLKIISMPDNKDRIPEDIQEKIRKELGISKPGIDQMNFGWEQDRRGGMSD